MLILYTIVYVCRLILILVVPMTIANKKAYTLVELMIAIALIGLGLAGILRLLSEGLSFVDRTRQDVVAINLAREWVEAVFSLRNSNWRKWSWKKDKCWLASDTFAVYPGTDCETIAWLGSWTYILSGQQINGQRYFTLIPASPVIINLVDGLQPGEDDYALCETGSGRTPCPGETNIASEGRFYRQIVGKGLFRKDGTLVGGNQVTCANWGSLDELKIPCGDDGPKEFRFCVRVASIKQWSNIVEQCAVITNFDS